ncbi:MAG: PAS domain S-box protein [Candidatus Zixiibacteriota bacterium]
MAKLPIPLYKLNDHWEIVHFNQHGSDLFRKIRPGRLFTEFFPDEQAEYIAELLLGKYTTREVHLENRSYNLVLMSRDQAESTIVAVVPSETQTNIRRELQEKMRTLTAITDAAQDAIIMINDSGQITFWNPAAETMFGYAKKEVFEKDLHSLLAPVGLHPQYKLGLSNFRKTGTGNAVGRVTQLPAIRKGGEEFSIELSLSPVKIGDVWHAVGVVRDVTEEVKSREKLEKSEKKYQELFNSVQEGITFVDRHMTIQFCNPAFADIHDAENEQELVGKSINDFVLPEQHELIKPQTRQMLLGQNVRFEMDIVTLKNVQKRILLSVQPKMRDGKFDGATGTILDITDRARAEKELVQSEGKFYDLFYHSMQPTLLVDKGIIIDFNNAALQLLKYNENESLTNLSIRDISTEFQSDGVPSEELVRAYSMEVMSTGYATFEWTMKCKDSTRITVVVNLMLIPLHGRQIIYGNCTNVSDKRRTQLIQQALLSISHLSDETDDLTSILRAAEEKLTKLLDYDRLYVALKGETTREFDIVYRGDEQDDPDNSTGKIQQHIIDRLRRINQPLKLTTQEVKKLTDIPDDELPPDMMPNWFGVPLNWSGAVIGAIIVANDNPDAEYSEIDVELLQIISDHLAVVIQRRRAQMQIKQNEERLKVMLEYIKVGIQLVDPESGRITYVNKLIEELIGLPKKLIIGAESGQFFDFVKVEEKGRHQKKAFKDMLVEYVRADGFKITALKTRIPVFLDNTEYYLESIVDITNYCTAQERQRITLYELQAIFDSSPVGIAVLANKDVVKVNKRLADMLGYQTDEMIGAQSWNFHLSEQKFNEFRELFYDTINKQDSIQIEYPLMRKTGEEIWVQMNGKALDPQDPSRGSIWIIDDISERRRFQAELQNAKEKAESASKAKSQFLANMSHEIRTPLNGILGMTDLALETELTKEQREFLSLIKVSGEGLLHVISDILDFSKIEAGRLHFEEIPFNIRETINAAIEPLAIQARLKNLELSVTIDSAIPEMAISDPNRLNQIIINLVGNAIKFTDEGSIDIQVNCSSESSYPSLHFIIADTGIGIPMEKQSRIFESFTQADGSTTRKFGGTGLGTTISRELVERMEGRMWLESPTNTTSIGGPGTTFHFTVDLKSYEQDKLEVVREDLNATWRIPVQPRKEPNIIGRVLLAEDNPVNQRLAKALIEKNGYRVDTASDGNQAIEKWRRNSYDLILMDIQMPNLGGLEAAIKIRKEEEASNPIPIIALTAGISDDELDGIKKAGMNDYIGKPVFPDALQACLNKYVPLKASDPAAEKSHHE